MLFCHLPCRTLPLVLNYWSKHSKPLGTKLIQILRDGNCLFRALCYAVTGRQVCYTRVRAQIKNHMNSSLVSYLVNGQMARNKVRVKGTEILSGLLSYLMTFFFFTSNLGMHIRAIRGFNINCTPPPPLIPKFEFVLL